MSDLERLHAVARDVDVAADVRDGRHAPVLALQLLQCYKPLVLLQCALNQILIDHLLFSDT